MFDDPLSHKHCWKHPDAGDAWWWDNGMICPEQNHPDHA